MSQTPPLYLSATVEAYDAVAVRYAELVRDALKDLPLDRSILAAFADYVIRDRQAPCPSSVANEPSTPRRSGNDDERPGSTASERRPLVLELGCGPGYLTAHLRDLGLAASGVDLSPAMIDLARRAYPDLEFTVGSMEALDVPDSSLDGIVAWYSIIHVPPHELPGYFAEFRRVLAPGGYLLLGFFEAEGLSVVPFDHKVTTAYRWPIDDLAALAKEADLEETGRMLREPQANERHRRGHLILRRR